jgi:hypothetical protein
VATQTATPVRTEAPREAESDPAPTPISEPRFNDTRTTNAEPVLVASDADSSRIDSPRESTPTEVTPTSTDAKFEQQPRKISRSPADSDATGEVATSTEATPTSAAGTRLCAHRCKFCGFGFQRRRPRRAMIVS